MDKYQYKVNGIDYDVEIEDVDGSIAKVKVNGKSFEVELKEPVKAKPKVSKVTPVAPAAAAAATSTPAPVQAKATANPGSGTKVSAPLPGTITAIKVAVGQAVKAGDTVVILEAMKMQNNIEAENSGTVTSILVNKGDTVMEGTALLTIG